MNIYKCIQGPDNCSQLYSHIHTFLVPRDREPTTIIKNYLCIDTIINCAEGSSIEFWTQFAFRGGSGEHNWKVIDFCPQRCLEALREIYTVACENSPQIAEYKFTDYIAISEWFNGFTQVSDERVHEVLGGDPGNAIRCQHSLVRCTSERLD